MLTAPQLIYQLHGTPVVGAAPMLGPCYLCGGESARGVPVEEWMGPLFTSQTRAANPSGTHVCEACAWVSARASPVPGRPAKDGKQSPNFRNFSHLRSGDGTYMTATKGEKPLILSFLRAQKVAPWFAAIADTGQKHLLPFTPVNPGGGRRGLVLFEERVVGLPEDLGLVADMAALLTAGATKEETELGEYEPRTWGRCGAHVRAFEDERGALRGSGWFALALWLAQRDEEAVAARMEAEAAAKKAKPKGGKRGRGEARGAGGGDGGVPGAGARVVPPDAGGEPAQALGRVPGAGEDGGADVEQRPGVGDDAVAEAAPTGSGQLALGLPLGAGRRRARRRG